MGQGRTRAEQIRTARRGGGNKVERDWASDEDMTNMHMTKAQAKIEFKAQSTLKSDLFASPVRTAGAGLTIYRTPN